MDNPQLICKQELVLVKDYVLLPVILDVLERDIGKMKLANLNIPSIYIGNLKHVQDIILTEMSEIKRELRNRGIKVYENERSRKGVSVKYLCRGYRHEALFSSATVKTCVIVKVCVLLNVDISKCEGT